MVEPYYQDEQATIYCGDCREILPTLDPVDLVLTDPPYGIGEAAGKNKSRDKLGTAKDYGVAAWDNKRIDKDLLYLVLGAANNSIVFGGNYYADWLDPTASWLVWDKQITGDFSDCELAWTSLDGALRRIVWRWNGMIQQNMKHKEQRWHPTQKPVPMLQWCIEQADKKQKHKQSVVLDPFLGSGSTLLAAKNLGRKAIGIELEEKYCGVAVKRLSQQVLL